MVRTDHIDANQLPLRTGRPETDLPAVWEYLYRMLGDLRFRLEDIERRLAALERAGKE